MDGSVTGLVVEGDVAAGDRNAKLHTPIGQAGHRLLELPHHTGVFWGAEVQAIRDRDRPTTADRHVAI